MRIKSSLDKLEWRMHFTGSVRCRPVRIGFLIPPDDISIVSRVARLCACLWGGRYHPIIPFFESGGDRWLTPYNGGKGVEIARGYINFFEPDVLVESTPGMAAKLGWENTRGFLGLPRVVLLDKFYEVDSRGTPQFAAGLDVFEVMLDLYDKEYKYERRHKYPFAHIAEVEGDTFFDIVCGRYPADEALSYVRRAYEDIFLPTAMPADAATAIRYLKGELPGPLWITGHELLESHGRGHRDQTFFVFDPTIPADAIDFWNFRLIEHRASPINVNWFSEYKALMRERIEKVHRPIPGNPFGTKFHTTICFAASISRERQIALLDQHLSRMSREAFSTSPGPLLWNQRERGINRRETKTLVSGKAVSFDLEIEQSRAKIPAPSPSFLKRSGRYSKSRWINVVVPNSSGREDFAALVYPTNLWSPIYPSLTIGDHQRVGREGWILQLEHDIGYSLLQIQTGREAIIGWLNTRGVQARPSEAGQIAAQVIIAAGGLLASGMFADRATLHLLGEMAEGHDEIVRDGRRTTKANPERSKHINTVSQHFVDREKRSFGFWNKLDYFLERSVFRAGLRVQCPVCSHQNWFDLNVVNYRPTCTRCLNTFEFSQSPAHLRKVDWFYRVVGPFAAPDFARGGYAVALTLRCLASPLHTEVTWSTGLELEPLNCEIDFMAWYRSEGILNDERDEPHLVLGEVKSFGRGSITAETIASLKKVAALFPGAIMVVSSLREITDYSTDEIARLRELAEWGRDGTLAGPARNPLITLTATELFSRHGIFQAWKAANALDAVHPSIDPNDLETLAELTQQRYLGLPPLWEVRMERQRLASQRQRLLALISFLCRN